MATGDNFITCGNDFDLQTIAMSLYGDTQGCTYLRQYCANNISDCSPIQCATFQTLTDLIRGSIAIAYDDRPALRVAWAVMTAIETGSAFECGLGLTWDEALKSVFSDTGGGDLAVLLGRLNADAEDMGVNLISCGNDIDLDTLMMSLIGVAGEPITGCNFIRVHFVYKATDTCHPIACGTFQTFLDLFRQTIVITDDGLPAIRVFNYTENSRDMDSVFSCAGGITEDEALNGIFWLIDGEIAIATACISDAN